MAMNSKDLHHRTGNSRPVSSAQDAPHKGLRKLVHTHLSTPWRAPLHAPTADAFVSLIGQYGPALAANELVFDSGCGTGESTRRIAERAPHRLVLGLDRSARRLARTGHQDFPAREGNIIWLRTELATFWRLALAQRWRLAEHYLLYPNPYPKPAQLRRRWHAHPVFPVLLQLGGVIELRCNWRIYADEFALAIERATGSRPMVETLGPREPLSGFERKYQASGQALYRLRANVAGFSRQRLEFRA